ncbi:MAG: bifunctional riboflavin kinase/FAD synthetase [Lachnospiraceae bacterium]|nr:bifunctional riboflavin kinase/FAD synthetase [Lachnospiraceae bacterium]
MEILDNNSVEKLNTYTCITIGKFDGLHTGHDYVFNTVKDIAAKNNLKTMVCTFEAPPLDFIDNRENDILLTLDEKKSRLKKMGIDYLNIWSFDEHFMHIMPEEFIKMLVEKFGMKAFVCGEDFRYGYRRQGDTELLHKLSEKYGFKLSVLKKLKDDEITVSSTKIKELLMSGDINEANRLLGYEYFIGGKVVSGARLGRKMGFPTANIIPEIQKVLPPFGVYESKVELGGRIYKGMTNIGTKPTVTSDLKITVETYLKDYTGNLYDEYIDVELVRFIRPEKKFNTIEELEMQIKSDVEAI